MDQIEKAAEALHDEAHADDKVLFRHCVRQTCKDMWFALESHCCDEDS